MVLPWAAARPCAICRPVLHHLRVRQRALHQLLTEGFAVEQLGHDEQHSGVLADIEDADDIRMRQRRDGPRLAVETRGHQRIAGDMRRQHLDRYLPVQAGIARAIDLPHPARAERVDDFVRTQPGRGSQWHSGGNYVRAATGCLITDRRSVIGTIPHP